MKLSIITALRKFEGEFKRIQLNAILSWCAAAELAGLDTEIIGVCLHPTAVQQCHNLKIKSVLARSYRVLARPKQGGRRTPYISTTIHEGERAGTGDIFVYINPDNILLPSFFEAVQIAARQYQSFVLVGERTDIDTARVLAFDAEWNEKLTRDIRRTGRPRGLTAMDYFVYKPRGFFDPIPKMAMACFVWDGWLMGKALDSGVPVVNISDYALCAHQDHENSKVFYKHPQRYENERLADATGIERRWLKHATYRMKTNGEIINLRTYGNEISRTKLLQDAFAGLEGAK
jgi:hypothetical protein